MQLTSTRIDAFASAAFTYSNASAAQCKDHSASDAARGSGCGQWGAAVNDASIRQTTSSCAPASTRVCNESGQSARAGGKGVLGSIGSALIGCVSKSNDLLNTPLVSSVGQLFNKFGLCGKLCHIVPDLCGYAFSKVATGVGQALGGTGSPNYHFEQEWLRDRSSSGRS